MFVVRVFAHLTFAIRVKYILKPVTLGRTGTAHVRETGRARLGQPDVPARHHPEDQGVNLGLVSLDSASAAKMWKPASGVNLRVHDTWDGRFSMRSEACGLEKKETGER